MNQFVNEPADMGTPAAPANNGTPAAPANLENKAAAPDIAAIFPQTMTLPMWVAIIVGLGLVATGLFSSNHGNTLNGATALLISIGAALIAATFGGNGSARFSGMLFAGCTAIMFGIRMTQTSA